MSTSFLTINPTIMGANKHGEVPIVLDNPFKMAAYCKYDRNRIKTNTGPSQRPVLEVQYLVD